MDAAPVPLNGFRVAIIGSGPGGIACADELSKLGYAVTVFESQLLPGGLLVNGIPSFKLEKSLVERRLNVLRGRGVEFRLGITPFCTAPSPEARQRSLFNAIAKRSVALVT